MPTPRAPWKPVTPTWPSAWCPGWKRASTSRHSSRRTGSASSIAATRAWRGEATAEALYLLGEIAFRRGTPEDLAKAQAHYQRIYLSYKRHSAWVSKAYLRSAETFEKLGQGQEALTTLNRFLTFRELEPFPEWRQALALKPRLEARVPAPPPPALAAHP